MSTRQSEPPHNQAMKPGAASSHQAKELASSAPAFRLPQRPNITTKHHSDGVSLLHRHDNGLVMVGVNPERFLASLHHGSDEKMRLSNVFVRFEEKISSGRVPSGKKKNKGGLTFVKEGELVARVEVVVEHRDSSEIHLARGESRSSEFLDIRSPAAGKLLEWNKSLLFEVEDDHEEENAGKNKKPLTADEKAHAMLSGYFVILNEQKPKKLHGQHAKDAARTKGGGRSLGAERSVAENNVSSPVVDGAIPGCAGSSPSASEPHEAGRDAKLGGTKTNKRPQEASVDGEAGNSAPSSKLKRVQ